MATTNEIPNIHQNGISHNVHLNVISDSEKQIDEFIRAATSKDQFLASKPMRQRNLPASFFRPPEVGTKSASHSRESSIDKQSINKQQILPNNNVPPVHQQPKLTNINRALHSRFHSLPASIDKTLSVAPQQIIQQVNLTNVNNQQQILKIEKPQHIQQQNIQNVQTNQIQHIRQFSDINQIPLPRGWEESFDQHSGRIYYINHIEKKTTWIHPITNQPSPFPLTEEHRLKIIELQQIERQKLIEQQQMQQQMELQTQQAQLQAQQVQQQQIIQAQNPNNPNNLILQQTNQTNYPHQQINQYMQQPIVVQAINENVQEIKPQIQIQQLQPQDLQANVQHQTIQQQQIIQQNESQQLRLQQLKQECEKMRQRQLELQNQQRLYNQTNIVDNETNQTIVDNESNQMTTNDIDPFLSGNQILNTVENHCRQESADSGLGSNYSLPHTPDGMLDADLDDTNNNYVCNEDLILDPIDSLTMSTMDCCLTETMEQDDQILSNLTTEMPELSDILEF